jgi:malto-oligosyltrehalose synthase
VIAQGPLGSTYRLQLAGLGFDGARQLVGYLSEFGIETLYVSPIFAAVPGSTHGYDVIDPTRLDPTLGTPEEFEGLLAELDANGMRLLIDIVPNHMAVHPDNRWWWDTQQRGEDSPFASTFDIDWTRHSGRVMVPTLPRPLAECVDTITFGEDDSGRFLELVVQRFPLASGSRTASDVSDLLARQHYQPAYWRLSNEEGNYRRFFDIDTLIGIRVEDPEVFERTHTYIGELAKDERIAGWRADHVDGLTDPAEYLKRLRVLTSAGRRTPPVILVEKILAHDELLPSGWPVEGTTGYEFADHVGGLFVDDEGARLLESAGAEVTGDHRSFQELSLEAKREVLVASFISALERLTRLAMKALDVNQPGHDLSWSALRQAVAAITSHLDVYRTYLTWSAPSDEDARRITRSVNVAKENSTGENRRAIELTASLMANATKDALEFAQRWQQLSGAVMAKGVEDTATYRYSGLLSHAEVGCDPGRPSTTPLEFQRFLTSRDEYSQTLNATSTHDSKRSEDARARLFTLSEVPAEWKRLVSKWHRRYGQLLSAHGPDAHDELVIYQSFVCLWPTSGAHISRDILRRLQDYVVKAAREAKRHTNWTDQNSRYERALASFASALARDEKFRSEMAHFMDRVGPAAATNSLAMAVMKCVAPGVPDFYQGCDLWEFTLTDPDNRRPIDFQLRRNMLSRLPDDSSTTDTSGVRALLDHWADGGIKLYVQRCLLRLRRSNSQLFDEGTLERVRVSGQLSPHVVPLVRRHDDLWVISVVPRLTLDVAGAGKFATGSRVWGNEANIHLPSGAPREYFDIFTGAGVSASRGRLRVAECLNVLPGSVLVSKRQLLAREQPRRGSFL